MEFRDDSQLAQLSDDEFREMRTTVRPFTVCILKAGPNFEPPGQDPTTGVTKIIWQHGKRNTALRMAGLMPIICPIGDGTEVKGICILDTDLEQANRIMAADPGVRAGVFAYELHASRSYAGSVLPVTPVAISPEES